MGDMYHWAHEKKKTTQNHSFGTITITNTLNNNYANKEFKCMLVKEGR